MTIASAFNEITENLGGTPSTSGTIAGAIDALNDTLAGSDQSAAMTIEGAIRLLGENIGGGGVTAGTLVPIYISWTTPEVGANRPEPIDSTAYIASKNSAIVEATTDTLAISAGLQYCVPVSSATASVSVSKISFDASTKVSSIDPIETETGTFTVMVDGDEEIRAYCVVPDVEVARRQVVVMSVTTS